MIKAGTQENLAFRLFCFSYKLRKIPPFREILHCVQNDTNKVCHVERKRNIPWKGKTVGLNIIRNIQSANITLPGVCSPVKAGEHTRRLGYERQYSRSDLYCGDSSLRSE